MHSSTRLRNSMLILLGVAFAPGRLQAQPVLITFWTIEARIAQADHVVIGSIATVARKVIVPPGGRTKEGSIDPNGQTEHTLTLKVDEVLKGNLGRNVDDLLPVSSLGFDKRYEEWSKAQTSILWFLGPTPKVGERRSWGFLPLGKPVAAEAGFSRRPGPPMFSQNLTVLKDEHEIVARARAYAKTSNKVLPIHVIRIPPAVSQQCGSVGPWNDLIVPVDPSLQHLAHQLMASPEDFVPKGEKLDPLGRYQLRFGGVNSLRHFRSDANVALLRSLLDDPLELFDSGFVRQYPLQTKAFEILLHWGEDPPLPKSSEAITELDLAGTDVTDAALKKLAGLKHLATLQLQGTKVTPAGLKHLAGLKKLTSLHLGEAHMSDGSLRVLREIGLLHTVSQATAKGDTQRPKSADDVVALALCRGPVTDAGLKELTCFKNLAWLDLRETRVTDAGLKDLASLKNLTRLLLKDTRVTNAGIDELRRALPHCVIDH